MNLLNVFGQCNGSKRLRYEDFKPLGWGYNDYFRYMSFCDEIRSAVIMAYYVDDLEGVTISDRNALQESLVMGRVQALLSWLENFSDIPLSIPQGAYKWLLYERTYESCPTLHRDPDYAIHDPDLLYQASFHFTLHIESMIALALKNKSLWNLAFDSRRLEEYSDQELRENIDRLETKISRLEDQEPEFPEDVDIYVSLTKWAKRQASYSYLSRYMDELDEFESELDSRKPPQFCPREGVLYVYRGSNVICRRDAHQLANVNCIIPTPEGEIRINAQYCFNCRKFIISETGYTSYQELYDFLPLKLCYVERDGSFPRYTSVKERGDVSPLRLAGYSVCARNGMSAQKRQGLLAFLIDQGIMEKYEIINYLEQFININGAKFEIRLAKSKWMEDAAFVRRYHMDAQEDCPVTGVRAY